MNVNATGASAGASYAQPLAPPAPPPLGATAALLGLSSGQLRAQMRAGASLASLAVRAGVSSNSLIGAIESDLRAGAPSGAATAQAAPPTTGAPAAAPASLGAQIAALATRLAGTGAVPAADDAPPPGADSTDATADVGSTQSNLSFAASSLGTDPGTLLSGLASGADLRSALAGPSAVGYGTTIAGSIGGGVLFDEYA
jgi:hypothetical protein